VKKQLLVLPAGWETAIVFDSARVTPPFARSCVIL
jgi:hypothetical protein